MKKQTFTLTRTGNRTLIKNGMNALLLLVALFCYMGAGAQAVYVNNFSATGPASASDAPSTIDPHLSYSAWTTTGSFTSFTGASGNALSQSSASATTTTWTLPLTVGTGYSMAVTSFSFWIKASGSGYNTWTLDINGTTIGTGSVSGAMGVSTSVLPATGTITLTGATLAAVSNLTGTVNVHLVWSGGMHGTSGTGRLDDFTLNGLVAMPCSGTPAAGTAVASPVSVCNSGHGTISVTGGETTSGITYQWQSSTTGASGSFTDISGATNATYVTPTLTSTMYYQRNTTCTSSSSTSTSSVDTFNVYPIPASITGTTTVCAGNTTTLSTTSTGGTFSSSNTAVATIDPTTGIVTGVSGGVAPITYTGPGGCFSASQVTVTSIATPASVTPAAPSVCEGAPATLLSPVAATFGGGSTFYSGFVGGASLTAASTASPYTQTISGIPSGATITSVAVSMNFGSDFLHDFIVNLQAPNGNILNLAGPHGSTVSATARNSYDSTVISSTGVTSLATGDTLFHGTFAADAGSSVGISPYVSNVTSWSSLYGTPNGTWTLVPTNTTTFPTTGTSLNNWTITINYTTPGTGAWVSTTNLYTDAAATTAYTGTGSDSVYVGSVSSAPATYVFTSTGGACTSSDTVDLTVNPLPDAGSISGLASVCYMGTISLTDATMGGSWTSDNTAVATVDASGTVTGAGAGSATISYTVTNSCGTVAATHAVTVNPLADTGTITGADSVCMLATTTYADAAIGGIWTSDNTAIATVDGATGVVTGVAAGTAVISYAVTNTCGTLAAVKIIAVKALADTGIITGTTTICATTTTTLADAAADGVWSSDNTAVATVDASGVVTGVAAGTATISYTVTNDCGPLAATAIVTVNALPDTGVISGAASVCVDATITLSTTGTGGAWSSTATGTATVDATTGEVTGVAAGTATISYTVTNGCGTLAATHEITVNPLADTGSISGITTICATTTTLLTDAAAGGVWSSDNTAVATVASTGVVTGVAAGTATISYAVTNVCGTLAAVKTVTVNALADTGDITGTATVCVASTTTLSNTATDGAWSSDNTAVATIDASGVVTGVAAGTATISYTATNGCGTLAATQVVTVNPLPDTGTISGTTTICNLSSTVLTTTGTGGAWTSDNTGVVTVDAGGGITGVSAGTATISYTVTNSCGTLAATAVVTVNALADTGIITGTTTVCAGSTTTLTDAATGGLWSSDATSVATVDASGVVTGVAAGTATISYAVTNSCGTLAATAIVTVNPLPDTGVISGVPAVCAGSTVTLSTTGTGGSWSSDNTAVATIDATTGVVTGVAEGTATISYTGTNSCGTHASTLVVTVYPLPNSGAISGTTTVCVDATTTLTETSTEGAWSSDNTLVATVDASGVVTGVAAGTATISYTATNSCGTLAATATVTVNPLADTGTISGATTTVCEASAITLTETSTSGAWSSDNTGVATVDASGVVTGVSGGTATISYTATNSCGTLAATIAVTVNPLPVSGSITGTTSVCMLSTTTLADAATGGVWSSDNTLVATVDASGVVTGVATGTANISYTVTNSCGVSAATALVTVNPLADTGSIAGPGAVCVDATITLTDASTGGVWSSDNTGVATVDASGVVTGVSAGTATISYAVTNGCGTLAAVKTITVNPLPTSGTISGTTTVCVAATTTLTDDVTGGLWSSDATGIATVNALGVVTGVSAGTATISYSVTTICGVSVATTTVTVNPLADPGTITGAPTVCLGATAALADAVTGGVWSSSNEAVATVDATGTVTGVAAGEAVISYGVTNTCGTQYAVTVETVAPIVTPSVTISSSTGSDTACTGSTVTYTAIPVNGGTAPAYQWTLNGTDIVTTGTYTYSPVNGDMLKVMLTSNYACVSADTASVTDIITVIDSVTPSVSITVDHNPDCAGTPVTFTAAPVAGGSSPAYTWTNDGINVATGPTYTYVPADGDNVFCTLHSNFLCLLVDTAVSNAITMSVVVPSTPTVTILSSPGLTVEEGDTVTLTAVVTGGSAPAYQWSVNGVVIPGATSMVFADTFANNDVVSVAVTNTDPCANTTSGSVTILVTSLGVHEVAGHTVITVAPNPNEGTFTIKGTAQGEVSMNITNMLGQTVYTNKAANQNGQINIPVQLDNTLPGGMYILNVITAGNHQSFPITVKR